MGGSMKKMCKWDKEKIRKNFAEFSETVAGADHACLKCGRVAGSSKALCKPEKLESPSSRR